MKIAILQKASNYNFPILNFKNQIRLKNYRNKVFNDCFSRLSERSTGYNNDFISVISNTPRGSDTPKIFSSLSKPKKFSTSVQKSKQKKMIIEYDKIFTDKTNNKKNDFNIKCNFKSTASNQINQMKIKTNMISKASNYLFSKISGIKLRLKLLNGTTPYNNQINLNTIKTSKNKHNLSIINTSDLYITNKKKFRNISMYSKYPNSNRTFYTTKIRTIQNI